MFENFEFWYNCFFFKISQWKIVFFPHEPKLLTPTPTVKYTYLGGVTFVKL